MAYSLNPTLDLSRMTERGRRGMETLERLREEGLVGSLGGATKVAKKPKSALSEQNLAVEQALGRYGDRVVAGEEEENRRGAAMEQHLRRAAERAAVPTISQETIDRAFTRSADQAGQAFLDDQMAVREYAGTSGITGGGIIEGLQQQAEVRRRAALIQTRGDLIAFKATEDSLDRQREFDRDRVVANEGIDRPISMLGIDYENQRLATRLSQLGIESNLEGDRLIASANKAAGKDAKEGALIGGIGSLVGGLIGGL